MKVFDQKPFFTVCNKNRTDSITTENRWLKEHTRASIFKLLFDECNLFVIIETENNVTSTRSFYAYLVMCVPIESLRLENINHCVTEYWYGVLLFFLCCFIFENEFVKWIVFSWWLPIFSINSKITVANWHRYRQKWWYNFQMPTAESLSPMGVRWHCNR